MRSTPRALVSGAINLYYGWEFRYSDGGVAGSGQQANYTKADKGMKRIGDRFQWTGTNNYETGSWSSTQYSRKIW